MLGVSGVMAENYIVPSASKVSSIVSGGYYVITGMAQDGTSNKYLYDNGTKVVGAVLPTDATVEKFIWRIVGNTSDGYTLQNKATGNYMSLGASNGSAISTGNTPQSNVIYYDGSYSTICNATTSQAIDVASNGTSPTTWAGSTTSVAGSRRLLIYEASIMLNKIYTIKAYFSDYNYTDLYLYNNNGSIGFNTSASNGVKDYWIARSSGNATYPWKFESGRGDGKFLSPTTGGLTTTGGWVQVPYCPSITTETCVHLRGSVIDADVTSGNIRNLATWNGSPNSGFANSGPNTGCYGSSHNNSTWSTDYIIEEVVGVDLYMVVSNINAGGVAYTPSYAGTAQQTNGGFYIFTSAPSASDFTAIPVDNYTAGDVVVDASAKTITVNYTANITYTLTDANGETYNWSASGSLGTSPTLTGCYGYTLSNEVWDESERTYTANITFPFPISSNDMTNWTYFGCHKYYGYQNLMWLYAKTSSATDIRVKKNVFPTNEEGENERYEWAIIPSFSNGAFTFTVKNSSTGTYITSTSDQNDHSGDEVSLSGTGTPLVFKKDATYNECWYIPSTSKYLSINSYNTNDEQFLGTWGNAHSGTNFAFIEPADFTTLKADLKDTYDSFNDFYDDYFSLIGGTYTETVEGALAAAHGNNETVYNVIKDGATNYFTASQFTSYQNAYINAMNGVKYVMPTSSFIRIKNADGSKYVKAAEVSNYLLLSAGGTDASSIFYLNGNNSLIGYTTGLYTYAASVACPIGYAPTYVDLYEFLLGSTPGLVKVHATTNPTGWGHGRYWKDADAGTFVDRTQAESATDYIIEEVTSLPVTITSANYATLYAPVALTIPSGVTAYTATISGDKLVLTPVSTTIPKNTGVLLYSATPDTYNFDITDDVDAIDGNAFSGTVATINRSKTEEVYNSYILSGGSNGIGFYRDGSTTLKGFKAFVDATPSGDVKQFLQFDFGDATAIQTISNALQSEDREIYNLAGQRLNSLQRGVNIVNGKKVLVK